MTITTYSFSNNKVTAFLLFSFIITCIAILVSIFSEDFILVVLSFVLVELIIFNCIFLVGNDFTSPLTWFSITYSGYAIGGFYYSLGESFYGKFITLSGVSFDVVPMYLRLSLIWAIVCYLFFCVGYSLFCNKSEFIPKSIWSKRVGFYKFLNKAYIFVVPLFLLAGFGYWIYVANVVAGGLFGLLLYFQVFMHFAADHNISTLPYHFYYAGILLWLIVIISSGRKIGLLFITLSLLGMVINLTQGRIMLSVTFVMAQIFFVSIAKGPGKEQKKLLFLLLYIIVFAFIVYFLRIFSNYYYIGRELQISSGGFLSFIGEFFVRIIGSGNVADLQQLVIIFNTWNIDSPLFGITYFDWARNSIGKYIGMEPSSIGLMIKHIYFQNNSGPPTPGAIGEAFVNFSILAPFFMLIVGMSFSFIYSRVKHSGSYILLMIYAVFLARFIFLYPKVDSTMIVNFLWGITPLLLSIGVLYVTYSLFRKI